MTHKRRSPSQSVSHPTRATNPVISFLHSTAMMGDERWEEAITALHRFLELDDNAADRQMAYQNLGACYLALERFDETLAVLDDAQRKQPIDPEAIYSRGVVYACASRFPDAIAAFELYARDWPTLAHRRNVKKTLSVLQQIERGEIPPGSYLLEHLQEQIFHNLEVDDFYLVESKARRMIAAVPERPEGHFALGLACLGENRYLEALDAFRAAQLRDPNYEPMLYNIGYTYLKLDQPELAISWLEWALHREPKKPATMHELGVACEHLGHREEAVQWWKRALKFDPGYELAQWRLHEVGVGPEPVKPLSPNQQKLRLMMPEVKARMRKPQVYRNGGVTLTFDGRVGFVLKDADNPLNTTIHAGSPFTTAVTLD